MRIDDRKVNGRVLLDALDPVDGFNILVESTGATWQWRGSPLDPEVAAIRLDGNAQGYGTARSKVLHYSRGGPEL